MPHGANSPRGRRTRDAPDRHGEDLGRYGRRAHSFRHKKEGQRRNGSPRLALTGRQHHRDRLRAEPLGALVEMTGLGERGGDRAQAPRAPRVTIRGRNQTVTIITPSGDKRCQGRRHTRSNPASARLKSYTIAADGRGADSQRSSTSIWTRSTATMNPANGPPRLSATAQGQRRCPRPIPRSPAFRRSARSVRFIFFAISASGVRAFEYALSSRTSSFVHGVL
jgi:hypothetical protein